MEGEIRLREMLIELQALRRAVRKKQQELNDLVRESATREWISTEDYLQKVLQSVLNKERIETAMEEGSQFET